MPPGFWANVAEDVPTELEITDPGAQLSPGGRAGELLDEYDQLYADFSPSGFDALTHTPRFGEAFLRRHHQSLLFGTDASYSGDPEAVGEPIGAFGFFDRFELPTRAWENIRFRNLERILRDPQTS